MTIMTDVPNTLTRVERFCVLDMCVIFNCYVVLCVLCSIGIFKILPLTPNTVFSKKAYYK